MLGGKTTGLRAVQREAQKPRQQAALFRLSRQANLRCGPQMACSCAVCPPWGGQEGSDRVCPHTFFSGVLITHQEHLESGAGMKLMYILHDTKFNVFFPHKGFLKLPHRLITQAASGPGHS